MKIDEGLVHVAVRGFLKQRGWRLVAGQYPGGSDDECHALNVMDPVVACDNSPDPRRHSENKLVPDLVALKRDVVLLIEMKPTYSADDEDKLLQLMTLRRDHLITAMRTFGLQRDLPELSAPEKFTLVAGMGFRADARFPRNDSFVYFLVSGLDDVAMLAPEQVASASVSDVLKGV